MFNFFKKKNEERLINKNVQHFINNSRPCRVGEAKKLSDSINLAASLFLGQLIFEFKDQENLFYLNRKKIEQINSQRLFKVLAIFYLHLYCKKIYCRDEIIKEIFNIFEIPESQLEYLEDFRILDEQQNVSDYSFLSEEKREYFENLRVSAASMLHFWDLLLQNGLNQNVEKRFEQILVSLEISEIAIFYYDTIVDDFVGFTILKKSKLL